MPQSGRVLVFIVAYGAEKHLCSVLDRIPASLINNPRIEILVIDDGSTDEGAARGRGWAEEHQAKNVTILRNPVNQGYGGNQKLGYRIAIEAGFDFVILLHGDGQYAPELLPHFIETWEKTQADVVLGSRMTDLKSARQGGMPWYKMIGNQVLTKFQNAATGRHLSEYHTGYRAYSTAFLRKVPFETNTNDFHFDTEILYQAFYVKARVEEFGIPTHYGGEVCRVNGLRYAKDILFATARFRMHQMGMLCDLKYRGLEPSHYEEQAYMAYSSHAVAFRIIQGIMPARLLDIGCGSGFIARRCRALGIHVTGIDKAPPLPGVIDEFRQADIQVDPVTSDAFSFDLLLLLGVIERLADPEAFLVNLRNRSRWDSSGRPPPVIILSTPNIAFAAERLNLLLGRFNYSERGILNVAHKRLFTRHSLRHMLRECGYVVEKIHPAAVPFRAVVGGVCGSVLESISTILARVWPSMFAFQFVVECRPKPGVMQLIQTSEPHRLANPAFLNVLNRVQSENPPALPTQGVCDDATE